MKILTLVLGLYQTNCYIVYNEKKEAFIVDPASDFSLIEKTLVSHGLDLKFAILTHAHGDHIGALNDLLEVYPVPVYMHRDEVKALKNERISLSGLMGVSLPQDLKSFILVGDGEEVDFSGNKLKFIHCPGHTPGGMSIYMKPFMFTGDTIFYRSIGRTDFPGGDYEKIISSCEKIVSYPEDTILLPGHGMRTQVSEEKALNPFLNQS